VKLFNYLVCASILGYLGFRVGWDCLHPETWDGSMNDPRVYLSIGALSLAAVGIWIVHSYREHQKLLDFIRQQQRLIDAGRRQRQR
jgi:heme exporter protein D